jgi:hypothetical protein
MPRKPKANGAARSNGHALAVPQSLPRPTDTRGLARLDALSREIAACDHPKKANTLLNEIKSMQGVCARLLADNYDLREKLFYLEVEAQRCLQKLCDRMQTAAGPGRGKRIPASGKLFQLDALGIKRSNIYAYRDIPKLPQAEIDSYAETCRAEHRVPTLNGLLNATCKRQLFKRNVRNRLWTEDLGGMFGCDLYEGDPSPQARTFQHTRQYSREERITHVLCVLTDMPEPDRRFISQRIDTGSVEECAQRLYERPRPDERRRFIDQVRNMDEAERNAPTNSSAEDTDDVSTIN